MRRNEEENIGEGIIIKKERHVSPTNHSVIREKIIKYFEDPRESRALAEIKRLSNKSKKSSKNIRTGLNDLMDFDDSDLKNNTELNRIMFREPVNERAVRINDGTQPNFVRRKKQFQTTRYVPKKKNMSLYDELLENQKNKDKDKNKFKVEKETKNEDKFDLNDKNIYEDKSEKNSVLKNNEEKDKKNYGTKNIADKNKRYNNNSYYTIDNTKPTTHQSNLRKNKRDSKENNMMKRTRFAESLKPNDNIFNNKVEVENDLRASYTPALTEEYKQKNNVTVENLGGKDKIVVNEYRSKSKDKKHLQKYKTEYVWDKDIGRLVEKRIFDDEDENNNKNIRINRRNENKNITTNIRTNIKTVNTVEDKINEKDKNTVKDRNRNLPNYNEYKRDNKKEENNEPKKEIIKTSIKYSKRNNEEPKIEIKTEKKYEPLHENKKEEIRKTPEKENYRKVVEMPKREENSRKVAEMPKRQENSRKVAEMPKRQENSRKVAEMPKRQDNSRKVAEMPKRQENYRKVEEVPKRQENYRKVEEMPKRQENYRKFEEIKTITTTTTTTIDNTNNNNNNNQPKRFRRFFRRHYKTNENKEQEKPKNENVIIEKKTVITIEDKGKDQDRYKYKGREIIKEREKKPEKKEEIKIETKQPQQRIYRRRNYYVNNEISNNRTNNSKEKEPEKKYGRNLNLTEINYESKYKKKPKIEHFEEKPKVVYSRKVIVEEKTVPQREPPKVKVPEKKLERYITPSYTSSYNRNKNANIRLNINTGKRNSNDKKDYNSQQQVQNNPYSSYLRGANKPNRQVYRGANTVNDLTDDLEKIENYYTNSNLRDDLKPFHDSVNEEYHYFKKNVFYSNITGDANMGDFGKEKSPYYNRNINVKDLSKGRVNSNDMNQKYSINIKKYERKHNYK